MVLLCNKLIHFPSEVWTQVTGNETERDEIVSINTYHEINTHHKQYGTMH